jgi:two-component system CheB/CheR fusion protein
MDGAANPRDVLAMEGHTVAALTKARAVSSRRANFGQTSWSATSGCPGWTGTRSRGRSAKIRRFAERFLVALTGYALAEDQRRARDAGFDAHLSKPTSIEQIREVVARAPERGPIVEPVK